MIAGDGVLPILRSSVRGAQQLIIKLSTFSSLAALVILPLACKQSVQVSHTAYVIGPSDDIKPLDKQSAPYVNPLAVNAAVLVATKVGDQRVKFCSGTLIAGETDADPWRVLTNHHCFSEVDAKGKSTSVLLSDACTSTTVYFGFTTQSADAAFATSCRRGSLRTNFEGDLAVFELQKQPPDPFRPLELWQRGDEAAVGRTALVIHYPDIEERKAAPAGERMRLPTAAVTVDDCKVEGPFSVEEWDLDRSLAFSVKHTCDLIHGSSGSGLIDAETGEILGVNWGGIRISYPDGIRTNNTATRISFVRAFLDNKVAEEIAASESQQEMSRDSLSAVGASSSQRASADGGSSRKGCGTISADLNDVSGGSHLAIICGWLLGLAVPIAGTVFRMKY